MHFTRKVQEWHGCDLQQHFVTIWLVFFSVITFKMSLLFLVNATWGFLSNFFFNHYTWLFDFFIHAKCRPSNQWCGKYSTSTDVSAQWMPHSTLPQWRESILHGKGEIKRDNLTFSQRSEKCRKNGRKNKTRSSCTIGPVLTAGLCSSENPIKAGTFPLCCCLGPRLLQRWSVSHSKLDGDSFIWPLEVLIMFWTGSKPTSFNLCLTNTCFPLTMTIHERL